jgi:hypothetical protein
MISLTNITSTRTTHTHTDIAPAHALAALPGFRVPLFLGLRLVTAGNTEEFHYIALTGLTRTHVIVRVQDCGDGPFDQAQFIA